jgi:hypothetical protein
MKVIMAIKCTTYSVLNLTIPRTTFNDNIAAQPFPLSLFATDPVADDFTAYLDDN